MDSGWELAPSSSPPCQNGKDGLSLPGLGNGAIWDLASPDGYKCTALGCSPRYPIAPAAGSMKAKPPPAPSVGHRCWGWPGGCKGAQPPSDAVPWFWGLAALRVSSTPETSLIFSWEFPLSSTSACCSRGSAAHTPDVTAHSCAKHFSASKPPLGSISSTDALCHHEQSKASLKSSHATPA